MNIFIGIIIAATCVAAEPLLPNYDLPYYYNYRFGYNPIVSPIVRSVIPDVHGVIPDVRGVIPDVHPVGYSLPYYAGLKSQYYDRDFIGQSRYGHVEPGQLHHAVQDAFGNKVGGFSYYDAEGKLKHTSYVADAAGYRVTSNDLPTAPVDTPEVAEAKAAHFAEHEKIKARSKRDVLLTPTPTAPIISPIPHIHYRIAAPIPHAFPTTNTVPVVKPDGFLADTPEVETAKSIHLAEVESAKFNHFAEVAAKRYYSPYLPVSPFLPINYPYIPPVVPVV